jgi:hypothetical protein
MTEHLVTKQMDALIEADSPAVCLHDLLHAARCERPRMASLEQITILRAGPQVGS